MFILLYLVVISVSYISAFKSDFTDEHLNKATPFVAIVSLLLVMMGLVGSLGR